MTDRDERQGEKKGEGNGGKKNRKSLGAAHTGKVTEGYQISQHDGRVQGRGAERQGKQGGENS